MITAFVYVWFDRKRRKFCIGSHVGSPDDGYITSTGHMKHSFKRRPADFKRRLVWCSDANPPDRKAMFEVEQKLLDKIPDNELGKKYYNLKKRAVGWCEKANLGKRLSPQHKLKISEGLRRTGPHRQNVSCDTRKKQSISQIARAEREAKTGARLAAYEKSKATRLQNAKLWEVDGKMLSIGQICAVFGIKERNAFHLVSHYADTGMNVKRGALKGHLISSAPSSSARDYAQE